MNNIKYFKPTSPALRHKIKIANKLININNKNLTIIKKSTGGRNFLGRITTRHLGGGHKQRIRLIDTLNKQALYGTATLVKFVYDPNRTNYLSLYETKTNKQFLRPSIEGQQIGDKIFGKYYPLKIDTLIGNTLPLKKVPVGTKISNIELKPGKGAQLAKAAGVFATIIKHDKNLTNIKLASKKIIELNSNCICTIGINNNALHNNIILGKAGTKRWLGIRPTVRGEAMNPIDHPHGGKTSGGVRLKTVYGKLAKFIKTK